MKFKIGVFGSNAEELETSVIEKAKQIGKELARYKIIIITGASSGLPYHAAQEAAKKGAEIWGYSPVSNVENQKRFAPNDDISIYKKLIFVPKIFLLSNNLESSKKYRNVVSTATCDAGIIISGRWGTLNEFTNLYDMGKIIGVLTGTRGVADELPTLTQKISKKSKAKIIFSSSPKELVKKVIKELKSRTKNQIYQNVIASERRERGNLF